MDDSKRMEGESVIIKLVKIIFFCILSIICAAFASYYILLGKNIGVVAFIAYIACAVKAINIISGGRR